MSYEDTEFDFTMDDAGSSEQVTETQSPENQPFQIDEQQWKETQAKLAEQEAKIAAADKWKADAARVFGGDQPGGGQGQKPDYLNELVTNPDHFRQQLLNEATQAATVQAEQNAIVNEFRQKNPELVPFESAINDHMQHALREHAAKGLPQPDFRQAVEMGIKSFRAGVERMQKAQQQQSQVSGAAMRLDTSGGQGVPGGGVNFDAMSRQEFENYKATALRKAFQ